MFGTLGICAEEEEEEEGRHGEGVVDCQRRVSYKRGG